MAKRTSDDLRREADRRDAIEYLSTALRLARAHDVGGARSNAEMAATLLQDTQPSKGQAAE